MIDLTPYNKSDGFTELNNGKETVGFIDKLVADKELVDPEKINFLKHVQGYSSLTHNNIKSHCESYFRNGKKFIGTNSFTGDRKKTDFIRMKDLVRFKGWINEIVAPDVTSTIDDLLDDSTDEVLKELLFDQLMNSEIKADIINDTNCSMHFLGIPALPSSVNPVLQEAKTEPWMVWSFPFPDIEPDILSVDKVKHLDCRAGLSEIKDQDKILYLHNTESCTHLRRPTVFDAEFYSQFLPNGKTKPLEECEDQTGLDEYVHSPNKFKNVKPVPKCIKKS